MHAYTTLFNDRTTKTGTETEDRPLATDGERRGDGGAKGGGIVGFEPDHSRIIIIVRRIEPVVYEIRSRETQFRRYTLARESKGRR